MQKLFTVCTEQAGEVSVHRACCERATQPYSFGGEVRFDQAQDQQVVTTRSPWIVTECLFTRLMLIKMYVYAIYSRFRIGTTCVFCLSESMDMSLSLHYHYRIWWVLSVLAVLLRLVDTNTLVLSTYLDVRARLSISNLRLPSDRRTILIGRLSHLAMISSPRGVSI